MKTKYILLAAIAAVVLTACDKVSPIGVLVSGTGVEDRVKMSKLYFLEHKMDYRGLIAPEGDEYTFLVGADSHMALDDRRMAEMLQIGLDNDDLLYAHLGDIADTKAEYYIKLEDLLDKYKWIYAKKYFKEYYFGENDNPEFKDDPSYYLYEDSVTGLMFSVNEVPYPFYAIVGNHDITHNGWALWSNIFHSSFYDVYVYVGNINGKETFDHFIFLDTSCGTLGDEQVKLIEEGYLDDKYAENDGYYTRNTFIFSHTNIFRPEQTQFSSTFAREETFFLLNKFSEWEAKMVFCGHVHKWDYRVVDGVEYLTLDAMGERNRPDPGDYLVRVHVKKDGTITWEKVHMYTKQQ